MINSNLISFLNYFGFSDIQLNIYQYLLKNKFGTIKDIKNELNYSYTQVYHNLLFLVEKNLVEASTNSKPKTYYRTNPKIALTELLNKRYSKFKQNIKVLDEELQIQQSKFGRCLKDVSFYHYSNINLAIDNFFDLIYDTKEEIVMTSLPPFLLKKLESILYDAFMRGLDIRIYFSLSDFEYYPNYFEELTDILKRIRLTIIQTEERTCQVVRYNDDIVNMGHILLDENYLNAIIFKENEIFHADGFRGMFAKNAKNYLEVLTVIKKVAIEYPEPIQNVLDIIKKYDLIKTRDLSVKSKIGGGKLKQILKYLIKEGKIKENVENEGTGRPATYYSIIESKKE
ncbi:MAG: helix-turn-helix domain-containing protein [Candidatus Hodarchaeota archaeon]